MNIGMRHCLIFLEVEYFRQQYNRRNLQSFNEGRNSISDAQAAVDEVKMHGVEGYNYDV